MTVREDIIDDLFEQGPQRWPALTQATVITAVDLVFRETRNAKDWKRHTEMVLDLVHDECIMIHDAITKLFKKEDTNVFSV